jgi:protein disulfide-isomerase A1
MMKWSVVCVLALAVMATAADFPEEDNVLVLDDDNFQAAMDAHDTLLVEFYAPWCGHCKRLAPEYAKAAKTLKKDGFSIAKVDATVARDTADKFEVQGYPTLKFFRNGKASDYTGGRTESDIVQWVRKKSGPPAKTLSTAAEATEFADSADVAVIGVFASETGAEAKQFIRAAGSNDEVAFGIATDSAVAKAYDVEAPAIVLIKKFDEGRVDFDGKFDADEIETFVSANQLPLVIPFTQENAPKIFGGSITTHLLVFVDSEADGSDELLEDVRKVAVANKGRTLTVTVGPDADRVLQYFGVTVKDMPTSVLVNMPPSESMKKYQFDGEMNEKDLAAFTEAYFNGDLKPFLKSDPVPESQDEPVYVLVGTEFEKVALDETKDVLVEFYAPWCGHCKSLAPVYEKVAETFGDVDSIVIAKMDATANEIDHPDVNVKGFPTIKFFPAKSSQVVDYDGARDEDGFVEFLKENAAIPFTLDGEDFGADHSEL